MATDATGTPTSKGIPKLNTAVDAPTGKGINAMMDSIDGLLVAHDTTLATKIDKPAGPSSGQALVWNGSAWVAGSQSGIAGRGTSFPGSPSDGDEFVLTIDATAGIQWRFKYRAASASAYKWEFIGGSAFTGGTAGVTSTANGTYDVASVTVPVAGDFLVRGYLQVSASGSLPATNLATLRVAANGLQFGASAVVPVVGVTQGITYEYGIAGQAAATVWKTQLVDGSAGAHTYVVPAGGSLITVTPIRCA